MDEETGRGLGPWTINFTIVAIIIFFGDIAISSAWEPMFEVLNDAACRDAALNTTHCASLCANTTSPLRSKACDAVTDGASRVGNLALVNNGCNFLAIALSGEVSDAFGRKTALIASIVGQALVTLALFMYSTWSIEWVYGITAVASLGGGQYGFYSAALASTADMTASMSLAERTKYYAILSVVLYAGLCAGPVGIGGAITMKIITVQRSFFVAIGIWATLFVLSVAVLRETRGVTERTAHRFSWGRSNPLGGVYLLSKHPVATAIGFNQFFIILGSVGIMTIVPVVMLDHGFDTLMTATWQTCLFAALSIGNIVFVPVMCRRWGNALTMRFADVALTIGMALPAVAFGVAVLAKPYVLFLFCIPIVMGAGWDAPGNSLAVTILGPQYYGLTMSGLNSIKCLLQGATAKIMTTLYAVGKSNGIPWLPFAACAMCNILGALCTVFISDGASVGDSDKVRSSVNKDDEAEPLLRDASNA
eukprot:m.136659 g.136659  ORF g.136659 m.136659 type:complete len:478 (-) comp11441_c1_seq3:2067-3500(-)